MRLLLIITLSFLVYSTPFIVLNSPKSNKISLRPLFSSIQPSAVSTKYPRIEIEYCVGCRWMLRSAWLAQELLTTFEKSIGEVALIPSFPEKGGRNGNFYVRVDGNVIWDRRNESTLGFPDVKLLKQLVRDIIEPDRDLGHSDKHKDQKST